MNNTEEINDPGLIDLTTQAYRGRLIVRNSIGKNL